MRFSIAFTTLVSIWLTDKATSFAPPPSICTTRSGVRQSAGNVVISAELPAGKDDEGVVDVDAIVFSSEEEKKEAVGNLVADDEWMGLSLELSETIRTAIVEDMKQNARDFLGKDEYKLGDISKEIDTRVKDEVAAMRGKEEYELFDFVQAMDEMAKDMTEEMTGKPYEVGDLSVEIDKRVKGAVSEWSGKDEYEPGDLSREIASRVLERVEGFTGKPYEFGDISREVDKRRQEWVKDFLGDEAANNYRMGDITKKFINNYTGESEYKFGDLSKKLLGDVFGKRKKGNN